MIAAKHLDLIIGIDIHMIQPPGPVPPLPIPHPFIGMVMDPMDYVPIIGATVWVNSLPRATAGSAGIPTPPHFPIGGTFIKPPGNEAEVFMGSATVLADGEPLSSLGMPVLSCTDIGIPAPPRPKKKGKSKSLFLPTSVLIAIPAGQIVLVGGPPTVNLMALGMRAGMAGLKKLKKSKFGKKMSEKAGDMAKSLKKKLKKVKCKVFGEPVEAVEGKVLVEKTDFELPGPIPLIWERVYFSTSDYDGTLGYGWHWKYDLWLKYDQEYDCLIFGLEEGRQADFPLLNDGESAYIQEEKLTLRREGDFYILKDEDGLHYWFEVPLRRNTSLKKLQKISNDAGFQIQFHYTFNGHLQEIVDSANRHLQVSCDRNGRMLSIAAPHPEKPEETFPIISYQYDRLGNLAKAIDPLQQVNNYGYQKHLITKHTDRNGLSFYYKYDGIDHSARCIHAWGDHGLYDTKFTYDLKEKYTIVENSLGHQTQLFWNEDGVIYKTIDPLGHVEYTKFGAFNQELHEVDKLGLTTYYSYDELGNRTGILYPDGSSISFQYEDHLLTGVTDQNGGAWSWIYNEAGQIIQRTNPLGEQSKYEYKNGLIHTIIDPAGSKTELEYDQYYNLIKWISPNGNVTRWKYDLLGRRTEAIGPKGSVQRRKFNYIGWMRQINEPDGNIRNMEFDGEGNVIRFTDQHRKMDFEYSGISRLKSRIENGTKVVFKYDTEENLIGIINEHGYAYRFELDANAELIIESGFDGLSRKYIRDAKGQIIRVERAGGLNTSYKYDLMGRTQLIQHSDGSKEKFVYRQDGGLIEATNDHISVKFERDELGRIIKEIQGDFEVTSKYNELGMRTAVDSSLGAQLVFERNQMGEVQQVLAKQNDKQWGASFQRDQLGFELERMMPGGVSNKWERDRLGRPVHQQTFVSGKKRIRSRQYSWDVNNRLRQITDDQKGVTKFAHDNFGNLASAQYSDGSFEYRMPDAIGNLFRRKDQKDRKYGPAGQLLEANGTWYEYDPEGNLIKKIEAGGDIWHYHWNASGMLLDVIRPDGYAVSFAYDALGRRISKTYRDKTTRWVWDGDVILHEWIEHRVPKKSKESSSEPKFNNLIKIRKRNEQIATAPTNAPPKTNYEQSNLDLIPAASAVTTWVFEPESFAPLAKLSKNHQLGIITDHLGTPVGMYDEAGNEIWQMDLSIYGEVRNMEGWREACPFRYPGQYEDMETGLYYNRFRYYDPEGGFYVSQDPIGLAGFNPTLYAYVKDSLIWIDPFGLECWSTARKKFWKAEAVNNPGKYSPGNLNRMADGKAPRMNVMVRNRKTGKITTKDVSLELHHTNVPQRVGGDGVHDASNLSILTPWEHEAVDPFRHTGSDLLGVNKGVGAW